MKFQSLKGKNSLVLEGLLIALFFLPPLVFVPISFRNVWIATNYTEVKFAAVSILAWAFFSFFVCSSRYQKSEVRSVLKDLVLWGLGTLTLLSLISATYALVWEAALYEAFQWFTLSVLYAVLRLLFRNEKWIPLSLMATVASFGVVTLIGFIQLKTRIPFLMVMHCSMASTFGAKNPCFVSLTSQIFLVSLLAISFFFSARRFLSICLVLLSLAELLYLALSQSRTSLAGLGIGLLFLTVGLIALLKSRKFKLAFLAILIFASITVPITARYVFPGFWKTSMRIIEVKVKPMLLNPSIYFQRARGQAVLDTLDMLKDNPIGVGAGNWGFAYPLYHKRVTKKAFSNTVQIMRAHNDYIQYLGELGPPGLLLLLGILSVQFIRLWKEIKSPIADDKERLIVLLLLAQLATVATMFLFTYYLEYPYRKFLFVFLMALVSAKGHKAYRLQKNITSS